MSSELGSPEEEYSLDSTFEQDDDESTLDVSPIADTGSCASGITLDVTTNYISSFSCSSSIAKEDNSASLRSARMAIERPPKSLHASAVSHPSGDEAEANTAAISSPALSTIADESAISGRVGANNVTGTTGSENYESYHDKCSLSSKLSNGIAVDGAPASVPSSGELERRKECDSVSIEELDRSITDVVDAVLRMHPSATPMKQKCSMENSGVEKETSSDVLPPKQGLSKVVVNEPITEGAVVVDEWRDAICPNTGRAYYYNRRTRETKWSLPTNAVLVPRKKKSQQQTKSPYASEARCKGIRDKPKGGQPSPSNKSELSLTNRGGTADSPKLIASTSSVVEASLICVGTSRTSSTPGRETNSTADLSFKDLIPPYSQARPQSVEDDMDKASSQNKTCAAEIEGHLPTCSSRRRLFCTDGRSNQGLGACIEQLTDDALDDGRPPLSEGTGPHLFCIYCSSGCSCPQMLLNHMMHCPAQKTFLERFPETQRTLESVLTQTWGLSGKPDYHSHTEDSVDISSSHHQDELCVDCGRTFAPGRLDSHRRVCSKMFCTNRPCPGGVRMMTPRKDAWSDCESTPQRSFRQSDPSKSYQYDDANTPIKSNCPFCNRAFAKGEQLSMHLLHCKKRQKTRERRRIDSSKKTPGKSPKIQTLLTEGGRCLPGHPKLDLPRSQQSSRRAAW